MKETKELFLLCHIPAHHHQHARQCRHWNKACEWHRNQHADRARTLEELEAFLAHPEHGKESARAKPALVPVPAESVPAPKLPPPAETQPAAVVLATPTVVAGTVSATATTTAQPPSTAEVVANDLPATTTHDLPAVTA